MPSNKISLIFLILIILAFSSGCVSPNQETKIVYTTITPSPTPTPKITPIKSTPPVPPTTVYQTPDYSQYTPKFRWGDIIECPYYGRFIILEGNPKISGVYTVYGNIWCPCVRKGFLPVQDTDENCRKVGTQNPNTICGGAQLRVLTRPEDSCYGTGQVVL